MEPISFLCFNDLNRKHASSKIFLEPYLEQFYTKDWEKNILVSDFSSLKCYTGEDEKDVKLIDYFHWKLSQNASIMETLLPEGHTVEEKLSENSFKNKYPRGSFVTSKNLLSDILNVPYDNVNQFTIIARYQHGCIYLEKREEIQEATSSKKKPITTSTNNVENDKHFLLQWVMKNSSFMKKPYNFCSQTFSIMDKTCYGVYKLKIQSHEIYYDSEIDGVLDNRSCEQPIVTTIDDLRKNVEIIKTDLVKNKPNLDATMISNDPKWITKILLSGAKHLLIGFLNENNELYDIKKIPVKNVNEFVNSDDDDNNYDVIKEKQKKWSPGVVSDFLKDFLTFVKTEMERFPQEDVKLYEWYFEIRPDGKDCISCDYITNE